MTMDKMAFIYMFFMIGVGQAGAQTQQIAPPSGGVSPLAWVIICALAGTVVAGAGRLLTLLASTSYERPYGLGVLWHDGFSVKTAPTVYPELLV